MPYRYNGKELEAMNGLNQYDYGARRRETGIPVWTTVDPLAEKHYDTSPYVFAGNNPVNRIDPNGLDWYRWHNGDGKYAIIWREGDAKTIVLDNQTYNDIGTTLSTQIDDWTTITYIQNAATSVTFTGIDKSDYVSQTGRSGCKVASDQMLAKKGVNSNGERFNVVNADANGVATTPTKSANKGISTIDNALENGKPIEVGVDYSPVQLHNKKPEGDGMTDHFIVISSKTETLNNGHVTSTTYNFFDPRQQAYGTNPLNILTRQYDMLKGAFHGTRIIPYTVTTVRTSSR
ncbi:RHS repeat-associated core domain-containing protein [Microbacter margulisiae]|uniref:RHS repeat-associated protein n=1 Tax=Microbacter margulisiae TaxID=1350067 RepID=A0A7W5DT49_9PORP|nr:RHS repeat-associated core domain-containing protein [Microbacter margulisiae]MBB3188591.1 RHS repeat-associated protein [Microbacter margulisiae]